MHLYRIFMDPTISGLQPLMYVKWSHNFIYFITTLNLNIFNKLLNFKHFECNIICELNLIKLIIKYIFLFLLNNLNFN